MALYAYTWSAPELAGGVATLAILRTTDGVYISPDPPGNEDWQDYQAWLAEGNTPDPPPMPPAPGDPIADSAKSLQFANAKSLAAQGRTNEAVATLIAIMEAQT